MKKFYIQMKCSELFCLCDCGARSLRSTLIYSSIDELSNLQQPISERNFSNRIEQIFIKEPGLHLNQDSVSFFEDVELVRRYSAVVGFDDSIICFPAFCPFHSLLFFSR